MCFEVVLEMVRSAESRTPAGFRPEESVGAARTVPGPSPSVP